MWIGTETMTYFHPAGSIDGRKGMAQSPNTTPMAVMTPKVTSRSDRSDFSTAFHEACISAARSSSPIISGSRTIQPAFGAGAQSGPTGITFASRCATKTQHEAGQIAQLEL